MTHHVFEGKATPHHLGISVSSLEDAIRWYSGILGFRETKVVERPAVKVRIGFVERDGFRIEFIERGDSEECPRAWKEPAGQNRIRGVSHLAFEVANLDATAAALREKGVRFAMEPVTMPDLGFRLCHVFDHEGNLVEFVEALTGS